MRTSALLSALAGCVLTFIAAGAAAGAARDPLPRHAILGAAVVTAAGGVTVSAVVPGSPAAIAGLQRGDLVTRIDGAAASSATQFTTIIRHEPAGKGVSLSVVRGGTSLTVTATVIAAPDERDPGVTTLYQSVSVDGTLRRTLLSLPTGRRGRLPAVMLIGGIGCFTVDVAANPQDGYMRIAHDIAKAGFVTLRLEKSGVGDSQGAPCYDVDFDTESRSYAVALDALRTDPHVDPARIYLLGHSIGTVIAPRLARSRPVAGLVVSEVVGRDWIEYELANLRRQLVLGGDPPDAIDAALLSKARCMQRLLVEQLPEAQIERDEPACKTHNGIYPVADRYVQQVAALNIIEPWLHLDVPVLAVYGTSDYVVSRADHRRIVNVVNGVHSGNATLQIVPAMDHNLLVAATPQIFYEDTKNGVAEPYNTGFSAVVVGWLCNRERCTGPAAASRD